MTRKILSLTIAAILSGCSTLPRDGPSGASVNEGATTAEALGSYALVPLTYEVTERIKAVPPQFFGTLATAGSDLPVDVIGEGDTLTVSIFDPPAPCSAGAAAPTAVSKAAPRAFPAWWWTAAARSPFPSRGRSPSSA